MSPGKLGANLPPSLPTAVGTFRSAGAQCVAKPEEPKRKHSGSAFAQKDRTMRTLAALLMVLCAACSGEILSPALGGDVPISSGGGGDTPPPPVLPPDPVAAITEM